VLNTHRKIEVLTTSSLSRERSKSVAMDPQLFIHTPIYIHTHTHTYIYTYTRIRKHTHPHTHPHPPTHTGRVSRVDPQASRA